MGIRYIQTINKTTTSNDQETNSVFLESTDTKRTSVIIFKQIENKCKKESHTGKWSEINKSQKQKTKR